MPSAPAPSPALKPPAHARGHKPRARPRLPAVPVLTGKGRGGAPFFLLTQDSLPDSVFAPLRGAGGGGAATRAPPRPQHPPAAVEDPTSVPSDGEGEGEGEGAATHPLVQEHGHGQRQGQRQRHAAAAAAAAVGAPPFGGGAAATAGGRVPALTVTRMAVVVHPFVAVYSPRAVDDLATFLTVTPTADEVRLAPGVAV